MTLTEMPAVGTQAVELLSQLPLFDLDTATEAVALLAQGREQSAVDSWAADYVFDLAASGVLEEVKDLFRIPARVRLNEAPQDRQQNDDLTRQVLKIFIDNARTNLGRSLRGVLGPRSADVLIRTIRVVAEPESAEHMDALISTIQHSERMRRSNDPANIVSVLRRYVKEGDRRLQLVQGLTLWQHHKKSEAVAHFERVLETRAKDRAEGIAAHLAAIHYHEHGDSPRALRLLKRSETALRHIRDHRGLSMTYTTHGRVLGQQAGRRDDDLRDALKFFQKAQRSFDSVPLDDTGQDPFEGTIRVHEAETYLQLKDYDTAARLAREAQASFPDASGSNLYATVVLARVLRDAGHALEALGELNESVIGEFEAAHARDLEIAKAYNVLATVYLKEGELDNAHRIADLSVQIGIQQDLRTHLGHAYKTLARVEIEQLGLQPAASDYRRIRALLYRATKYGVPTDDLRELIPRVSAIES